jgi:hypothetical protein
MLGNNTIDIANNIASSFTIALSMINSRQMKWIRNRLTGPRGDGVPIYRFDSSVLRNCSLPLATALPYYSTAVTPAAVGIRH